VGWAGSEADPAWKAKHTNTTHTQHPRQPRLSEEGGSIKDARASRGLLRCTGARYEMFWDNCHRCPTFQDTKRSVNNTGPGGGGRWRKEIGPTYTLAISVNPFGYDFVSISLALSASVSLVNPFGSCFVGWNCIGVRREGEWEARSVVGGEPCSNEPHIYVYFVEVR
jgi:hypothetical protein